MRILTLVFLVAACAPKPEGALKRSSSERERDSVLGASKLPGASGVRGALRAADSGQARNARIDSVAVEP